jgi:hypothetical protein
MFRPNPWLLTIVLLGLALLGERAAAQEAVSAETQQEIQGLQAKVDGFFRSLTDKTLVPERAIREIIGNGPLKERTDDISKLIDQAQALEARYGSYVGHEAVGSKAAGSDLVFLRYLYKGERFPVVWHFTFYRTAAGGGVKREWMLIGLKFDSKLDDLER